MRWPLGLQTRLLLILLLSVTAALAGSVLWLQGLLVERLGDRVDGALRQEGEELRRLVDDTGPAARGDGTPVVEAFLQRNVPGEREFFVVVRSTGRPLLSGVAEPLGAQVAAARDWASVERAERGRLEIDGRRYEHLAVPLRDPDGPLTFVVVSDYDGERSELDEAVRVAAVVATGSLAVTGLLGALALRRALRPLRALTAVAAAVDERGLDTRLPAPVGSDDVATLTRAFDQMLQRLGAAFAAQRALVADAGHELRTPLTVVRGHVELLLDGVDDPVERRETQELVLDELGRMSRLVEDLLLLARADGADLLRPEPVDVDALLRDVLAKTRVLGERAWTYDGGPEVVVMLDGQRLTQALVQLCANAVQHTAACQVVGVGGALVGGELHLWVRDDGEGIAAADHERVFARFARASGTRRRSDGAGLGLAIVAAVAGASGGRVDLFSRPGVGSTFVVVVPARSARSARSA